MLLLTAVLFQTRGLLIQLNAKLVDAIPEALEYLLLQDYDASRTAREQAENEVLRITCQPAEGEFVYRDDANNRPLSLPGEAPNMFDGELFDGDLPEITDSEGERELLEASTQALGPSRPMTKQSRQNKRARDSARPISDSCKQKKKEKKKERRKEKRSLEPPKDYKLQSSFAHNAPVVPELINFTVNARDLLSVSKQVFTAGRSMPERAYWASLCTKEELEEAGFSYIPWDGV
jgi:hypothetical protein